MIYVLAAPSLAQSFDYPVSLGKDALIVVSPYSQASLHQEHPSQAAIVTE
jgi:hypothetical protein